MSASAHHPARVLFSSPTREGLIDQLLTRAKDTGVSAPRTFETENRFQNAGMPHTAELVRFLAGEGSHIRHFGTGHIDLDRIGQEQDPSAAGEDLQSIFIGELGRMRPLTWFGLLSCYLDEIPVEVRPAFDLLMADFHEIARTIKSEIRRT